MADDNPNVIIEVTLDDSSVNKAFENIEKEGDKAAQKVGTSFSDKFKSVFSGGTFPIFTELNSALSLAEKGFRALSSTIQSVVNQSLIAEDIAKINKQFDILISQSGNSASAIRRGLEDATGGVVDFEDALKAAAQASIRLGQQSNRIPELFELARKAAATFGGDSISVFNDLASAIQNGNARLLRQIGLNVDFAAAQKAYAKDVLGVTRALTEQEKTQANLNVLLLKANETYKNIGLSSGTVTESFNRLKVSTDDFFEGFATAFNNLFGPAVKATIDALTALINKTNQFLAINFGGNTFEEKTIFLTTQIRNLSEQLKIATVEAEKFSLNKRIAEATAELEKLQQTSLNRTVEESEASKRNAINQTTEAIRLQEEANSKRVRKFLSDAEAEKLGFQDRADFITTKLKESEKALQDVGQQFQVGFVQGIAAGFAAIGRAAVQSQNIFKEFGKAVLGVIGNLLITLGQAAILVGILGTTSPVFGFLTGGPATVAAGIALTVLGGALQAIAQSAKTGGAGGTVTASSGAGIGGPALVTQEVNVNEDNLTRAAPETVINVNVEGNVFDSDETGLRLVEVINNAFDRQGVTIRQGAVV